jgi:hypothetical protein|nr:MAG TPA: Large polyvalent protein-associated domain 3 [Caudoviricetes sp.]
MKLGVMTPDEWLQNTVGQANKNKGNSSSSSKKPSSNPAKSSSSKNNGVFTGNFAKDFETRKNIQKKQNSYGAKLGKAAYDTQAKRLQDKIDSARDGNARTRYQNQLAELRARANATLPGGLAGMEEAEERETSAAQRRAPREQRERQAKIDALNEKLSKTTDRRTRAAYRQEIRDLEYPLSASDQRLGHLSRDIIQDAKEQYDEGTQLIREGFEEEGRRIQEQAHLMAEYQRALAGYSGGGSGEDRFVPELTAQENQIMTAEGKQALRAAKRLYELGEETGNEELKETGRILGQNVRLTQNSYDLDKIRELRSKEPTVKRTDAHGRPIYTPTELEAEGQRNFFPAIWNQITGSLLSLGEAAHAATREAISNRNNTAYQSNQDAAAYWDRQARTAQTEEARKQAEENAQKAREMVEQLRAKEEVHPWSEGQWRLRQAAQQQETVQNSIDSPFGRLVNQAAMSALGMAPALGLSAVAGPAAGAALMGAQAAGGKAGELLSRGESGTEALGRGLVSGAIEGVTEKIPIGNLVRIARGAGGASWLRNMARQAGIEATEESASYALNYAADVAARDPEAEFSLQDLLEGAAVGALTGGALGGGASALSGGTTAARGRTRGGTAAAQDAARRAVQEVTRETQAQMPSAPENPLLQTIQETRREQEQAARMEPEEPQGPQSVLNQVVEQAAAERNARREADTAPAQEAPQTLAEREARYQQRYQDYMQRARAAAEDPSLQTPENYQALRLELDEIQNEYNGILQARRVESGEVSTDYNTPENHIDNRTTEDVENRSVKAFQFDYPQLHPYYVQAAQALMEDANWSLETQSNQKGKGTVARYSEALERAANLGLSRQEIIRVCQDIITDRGQENYAAAKKVELILDQMLSEGYTPNEALGNPDQRVGPNEAYLQTKEAIPGAVTRDSFEHYLRQNALAMDAGEVTEEQLRQEWEARRTNEESDGMSFWTGARQGSSGDITSPSANRVQENERTVNNNVLQKVAEHQDEISAHGTVSELTGNEFSDVHTRKEIENAVTEFYQEIGAVDRPGFGTVRLGRRGVKDSLAHGYGQKKIAAFASVPDVIQDGVQIDYQPNWKGRDYDTYIIAGDVTIGGEPNTVGVVLIRRKNDSRFYLHEVTTTKNGDATSFQTGATEETSARLPGDVTSPMDIIQDRGATVNPELPEEQARYSVGAAPSGFDPYSRMLNEYGAIAPGEKPARMVDVPRSTDGQDRVRQSARTFMEAEATPDALVNLFQQGVVNKEWSYNPKKDKASVDRAMGILRQRDGFQNGLNQWNEMVSTGRQATKDDVVMAQMIYKAAANAGDYETAGRLAGEIAALGTISGQNIQALRLLKRATPEGKLFYIQKGVDQVNDTMEKKYGEGFHGIEVPDELYQQYMNAETNEAQIAALDAIYDYVAERVPRTFGDALDTWRYFAMLGNPRTHIRNVLGNVIMQGPIQARNALSAGLQNALLPQEQRTRSVGANRATRDFARQDFEANKDVLRGNPYTTPEGGEIMRRVREKGLTVDKGKQERSAFWRGVNTMLKPLQGAASANSNLMDFEDMVFKKSTYINSLSNFLKARGYDPSTQDIPENVLEEGRGQAIEDALESTFQNYSSLASKLAELESSSRAAKLVIGGLMPFKKTPINITKRSIEFSPIGLFRGMHQWLSKVPKGETTAAEALDNIAAGITGSGIVAIGAFLASQGLINAGDDEDDRLRDFGVAQGSQEYSLNVGDYSYTIDWAAPSVIPLFLGVEGYNAFKRLLDEQENEDSPGFFTETVNAISRMFEPMMNMTMLSGLSGAIQSAAYNQANPIIGIGSNVAQNFLGQVFPTLSGQIARTIDDTRRTTFYDKTTDVPKGLQTFLQTQMNKIPGLSQRNPAWLDSWGRADVTENPLVRFLENFLSPGYIAERNTDDVDTELQRLYDLGEEGVLPKNPEKSAEVDGKRLTAEQWQTYAQTKGSESRDMLEGIISSPQYQELSDQDKAKVVRKVFEYGTYSGKEAIGADTSKFDSWYGKLIEGRDQHGISPVDYLTMYIGKSNIDNDESKSNQQQGMDVAAMIDSNDRLNDDQKKYLKENLKVYNFNPVNIGDDSKYQQAINAGFSPEEAAEGYKIIEGAKAYGEDGELDESEFERYMREKMSIEPGTEEYNKYLKAYGNRDWKSVKALIGDTTSSGHKGYTMNDQRYSSAVNAGFDEEAAKELSIGRQVADQEFGNGNGTLSKNELVNYIQSNYSQNQWRTVYSVLANSNWKNPFG